MALSDLVFNVRDLGKLGVGLASAFKWSAPLLARLTVGLLLMVPSTWTEASDVGKVGGEFLMGYRWAVFAGGALLVLGLGTRLVALALGVILALGLAAKASTFGGPTEYFEVFATDLVLLLFLICAGPGPVSLDRAIWGRLRSEARVVGDAARRA